MAVDLDELMSVIEARTGRSPLYLEDIFISRYGIPQVFLAYQHGSDTVLVAAYMENRFAQKGGADYIITAVDTSHVEQSLGGTLALTDMLREHATDAWIACTWNAFNRPTVAHIGPEVLKDDKEVNMDLLPVGTLFDLKSPD